MAGNSVSMKCPAARALESGPAETDAEVAVFGDVERVPATDLP
jgi:hypothetical protein